MADDKSSPTKTSGDTAKRPYATLDLRATEIKVTPVATKTTTASVSPSDVPKPAAARTYATGENTIRNEASMATSSTKDANAKRPTGGSETTPPNAVVKKRGGFFSHMAAGLIGGAIALGAAYVATPRIAELAALRSSNGEADLVARIAQLEKNAQTPGAADLNNVVPRIAALEKTAAAIPELTDAQKRLVAETKAALASAASDAGSPELIERIGKLEDKLKALADAGVNDPSAGRIPQLAALTSKVTDLEAQLGTQVAALRSSVTKDVDARVQAATDASDAAKSGTERIDKDVANIKSDTARIEARVVAAKDQADHVAADVKLVQEDSAQLKTAFDAFKATAAKPNDIATAVAPISDRMATLAKSVQQVVASDVARKETAERVVLALELQNLRRALDSGQKFSTELDAVKKAAGNQVDLSALTALQDRGVPSLADLTKEFHTAADRAIDADADVDGASVVDRLWAGAKSVVRVRRIDLKPEDKSTEATVGRMQVALNDGRLSDVLESAKDLSPKAQDAARPFLEQVSARASVDTAVANLEAQLKSSIESPQSKSQP